MYSVKVILRTSLSFLLLFSQDSYIFTVNPKGWQNCGSGWTTTTVHRRRGEFKLLTLLRKRNKPLTLGIDLSLYSPYNYKTLPRRQVRRINKINTGIKFVRNTNFSQLTNKEWQQGNYFWHRALFEGVSENTNQSNRKSLSEVKKY